MPERHTLDFARCSFNVLSDGDRRTVTLQWHREPTLLSSKAMVVILDALRHRYGRGLSARLRRWRTGERHPFLLPPRGEPHPDHPDVICYEIQVREGGGSMDTALASLLEFFRQQPGYERTYGAPLDLDEVPARGHRRSPVDASTAANRTLRGLMERRRDRGACD